ncbi:histidine phosphatase family protein [Phenylobacterium soli]|uniref:Histidine phosphatase family protein n=1 Tax=Phenylobacterium soli TaxID=2170551 RepID=A0A328AET3_9CAUL|nr:histidine phosphatase family protein [Phenylobacterium soli]RAK53141.1 histidine phosphatase family protein [Phenylobacterium soli]
MIYLVRHGQTEWNVEQRIQGRTESPLTPRGRLQAQAMAELLAQRLSAEGAAGVGPGGWRLVASPLGRAQATAAAIAERTGLRLETEDRLAEICCGEWEGRLRSEIFRLHPERLANKEWFYGAPGGETYEAVWRRVADFLADLPPEPERRLIVVGHGVSGRLLRGAYAGFSRRETIDQDVPQDAVFRLVGGRIERFDCPEVPA